MAHTQRHTQRDAHRYTANGRLLCRLAEAKSFRSQLIFPVNCTDDSESKGESRRGTKMGVERKRARDGALVEKSPKKKLKVKLNVSSAACEECVCVPCALCLLLTLPDYAFAGTQRQKSNRRLTHTTNLTSHGRNQRSTRHTLRNLFLCLLYLFFIYLRALLIGLTAGVCLSNMMADQLETAELARCAL